MLTFTKLSRKPSQTRAFTGLKPDEFQELADIYRPLWEQRRVAALAAKPDRQRAAGGGRRLALASFDNRLLCFLVYAKLY